MGPIRLQTKCPLALTFVSKSPGSAVVIDAGSNNGDWLSLFLTTKSSISHLLVTEPQLVHQKALNKISEVNPKVFIEYLAIGAEIGKLTLYGSHNGSPLASLYTRNLMHDANCFSVLKEEVQISTSDKLVEAHLDELVDFIKLDLEGHELQALRGSKKLLETNSIGSIMLEFGGTNIDSRIYLKDFWNLLVNEHQFALRRLTGNRQLKYLSKYSESFKQFCWHNILLCALNIKPEWPVLD